MEISNGKRRRFTQELMQWHAHHNERSLPWKQEKDPYRIWLSEVILQQTRAQQAVPYYHRFLEAYPGIGDMAAAEDTDVFRIWQGLGYYNRCRNMLATARYIVQEYGGRFPPSYEALLSLKGIGPYTAAAVGSFAFGLPYAVVDGNVYRVLARVFGIDTPIDSTAGKQQFRELADSLLDTSDSAGYNQAIMDLGATVCTPASPACHVCPLGDLCFARDRQATGLFPVKSPRKQPRHRYFHYILLRAGHSVWIRKRGAGDVWQDLHEPYLIETEQPLDVAALREMPAFRSLPQAVSGPVYEGLLRQRLTHQLIETRFYSLEMPERTEIPDSSGFWLPVADLEKLAFPKTLVSFFKNKSKT